jgi:hypothetical protein
VSFFALAGYVTVESVRALVGTERAGHSAAASIDAAAGQPTRIGERRRAGLQDSPFLDTG